MLVLYYSFVSICVYFVHYVFDICLFLSCFISFVRSLLIYDVVVYLCISFCRYFVLSFFLSCVRSLFIWLFTYCCLSDVMSLCIHVLLTYVVFYLSFLIVLSLLMDLYVLFI